MEESVRHLANWYSNSKLDRLISMRGNDALVSDSALSSFGLGLLRSVRSPLKTCDFGVPYNKNTLTNYHEILQYLNWLKRHIGEIIHVQKWLKSPDPLAFVPPIGNWQFRMAGNATVVT